MRRLAAAALTVAVLAAGVGCGSTSNDAAPDPTPPASSDPWADIDTTVPSEDPVGTVYGYVQAMAAGDAERACEFQYRGTSDFDDAPCVLADEQPARDARRPASTWTRLAAYELEDYRPSQDDRGWVVALPDDPVAQWRIRQDDAGIWHIA
ncbi:hypothetical protein [Nocardioides sp. T2.26MG-1]|uniref:hypothetical protein n=1 Tax=Nocardioides sp. T2.26MG-1 TaxID=3041166 RepID=UPI0024779C10|nr:hypothetical protein [Nocardioides sp. T2.26MG-1]CAI9417764.1 hypothetical protein HIDPHFAB_03100 [Nocardioides sp. T2.26MG-1]